MGTSSVDPHALWFAAHRLDEAADVLVAALSGHLGSRHVVSAALDQLIGDVGRWQQAARETASALRAAAGRYTDAEVRAAELLR